MISPFTITTSFFVFFREGCFNLSVFSDDDDVGSTATSLRSLVRSFETDDLSFFVCNDDDDDDANDDDDDSGTGVSITSF